MKPEPGQIVVASVLRQLARGRSLLLSALGYMLARHSEEPFGLYAGRWRDEG